MYPHWVHHTVNLLNYESSISHGILFQGIWTHLNSLCEWVMKSWLRICLRKKNGAASRRKLHFSQSKCGVNALLLAGMKSWDMSKMSKLNFHLKKRVGTTWMPAYRKPLSRPPAWTQDDSFNTVWFLLDTGLKTEKHSNVEAFCITQAWQTAYNKSNNTVKTQKSADPSACGSKISDCFKGV